MRLEAAWVCLFAVGVGCGDSSPARDLAGDYAVTITEGTNACMVPSWMEGKSFMDIPVTVTQTSSVVTVSVGGVPGGLLTLEVGSATFSGTVSGSDLNLAINGI